MSAVLGLDLGTTSISAVAVDASGQVLKTLTCHHAADVAGLPPGHAEQDPVVLRQMAWQVLRELTSGLPHPLQALGLTGQMHGILLLDRSRRPLTRLMTWQDRRAVEPHPAQAGSLLDVLLTRCDEEAARRAGCRLAAGFGGTTLFALRQTGRLPHETAGAAVIADWLAAELTGGALVTDRSNAASLGLYDLQEDRWSPALLNAAEVPEAWLPRVAESGAVIGCVTPAAAAVTGLPSGLPVCNALGDNPAAIVGSVPLGEEVVQVNIGTGGQLARILPRFEHRDGMETRYLPLGRYMLVGAGLAGGDAFAWVQRTVTAWLRAFGVVLPEAEVYARLEELMRAAPVDAEGLKCVPYFRGTRREPSRRGEFHGVSAGNFTPANMGRAVLNAIAAGMEMFHRLAASAGPWPAERIIATGNAVRRNPLLTQRLADALGLPIDVPTHREEAAYGAALLAGAQIGLWRNLEEAGRCIRHQRIAEPQRLGGAPPA